VTFGKEEVKEVEHPSPNVRSWDSSNCWNFSKHVISALRG
jgi:hypothetical protein